MMNNRDLKLIHVHWDALGRDGLEWGMGVPILEDGGG